VILTPFYICIDLQPIFYAIEFGVSLFIYCSNLFIYVNTVFKVSVEQKHKTEHLSSYKWLRTQPLCFNFCLKNVLPTIIIHKSYHNSLFFSVTKMLLESFRNSFHKTILFLYIAMLLFNFWFPLRLFKDSEPNSPPSTEVASDKLPPPDLWDHGVQGFLFLLGNRHFFDISIIKIGILVAPRTTLIFFASIPWNVWFLLGVFIFPEYTLIFLAFSRGYHHSNYLLLAMYCLWKLWAIHVIQGAQDSQEARGKKIRKN
jgi:hypothetical protein